MLLCLFLGADLIDMVLLEGQDDEPFLKMGSAIYSNLGSPSGG